MIVGNVHMPDLAQYDDATVLRVKLLSSLLEFTRVFYQLLNARPFVVSYPEGRESHHITVAKALTSVFYGHDHRLIINIPPGHGKSTMLCYFVAWAMAHYPDSQFLYISYSGDTATKCTYLIKQIMELPQYRQLFGVEIKKDSSAKDSFQTTAGGAIKAFGSSGGVTGMDGGLPHLKRFSGAIIMDDMHKPDEVNSDVSRNGVIDVFNSTIKNRQRSENVPFIFLGQRLHEADLPAFLLAGKDGYDWKRVILKSIDEAGNALYPSNFSKAMLLIEEKVNPYQFSAQHQQNPQPAGGGLFKPEWFVILDEDPEILSTFITADTAETDKSWNDATVFSFWGLYKIKEAGVETDIWGLHWINSVEIRVEPKDLEGVFRDFYSHCLRYKVKPTIAGIEKKSTGVTLLSVLDCFRGLKIMDIDRNIRSGNKTTRFLSIQPYIASKRVSFTKNKPHVEMCIEHCRKITANNSHRFDDICFVAGTRIATPLGYKNIEDMRIGDSVITPYGIRKVTNAEMTSPLANVIEYSGLIGTPAHPIFIGAEFKPMGELDKQTPLNFLSLSELIKWKYKLLLNSMASSTVLWGRNGIISANQKIIKNEKVLKDCMSRFGNFITERKYLKAISFITKTIIISITTLITWNVFRVSNILRFMHKKGETVIALLKNWHIWKKSDHLQKDGMQAKREENGIVKIPRNMPVRFFTSVKKFTLNAIKTLLPKKMPLSIVETIVVQEIDVKEERSQPVYNITVEDAGVYYANDILVSNCDTLADACRMVFIDEIVSRGTYFANESKEVVKDLLQNIIHIDALREKAHARSI